MMAPITYSRARSDARTPMPLGNMRVLGVRNLLLMSHNSGGDEQTFGAE
jgi:hypothetical protein